MTDVLYETERLRMRDWRDADLPFFREMSADPEVMRYFPSVLSPAESDAFVARIRKAKRDHGLGFPAVELKATGAPIGLVGLQKVSFEAAFTPAVEIGWRIVKAHWRQGYAAEAAAAALAYGFERHGLDEVVSFTIPANAPSQAVMRRIGMSRVADGDFPHPSLPASSSFSTHVLYRITRPEWARARA